MNVYDVITTGDEPMLFLFVVTGCVSVGKIGDTDIFRITTISGISLQNRASDDEYISDLKKFLSSGSFYFSWSPNPDQFDLSLCAQKYLSTMQSSDNRFFWLVSFNYTWKNSRQAQSMEAQNVASVISDLPD